VWRWEGGTLKPLEVRPLDGTGACAAAFSPDGKLLATLNENGTDIWEVGEKELKYLGNTSSVGKRVLFAPDGRSLAIMKSGSFDLYDLGPILPECSGWERWVLLFVALGLLAAVVLCEMVRHPTAQAAPGAQMVLQNAARAGWSLQVVALAQQATKIPWAARMAYAAKRVARGQHWLSIAAKGAFLGVVACVAWWALPAPTGAPLSVGLGFAVALAVLALFAWEIRMAEPGVNEDFLAPICFTAVLGAVICLGFWAWQFWWPSPSRATPWNSDLGRAHIRSACFSADGSELAALRFDGRLSAFDVATGKETHNWMMPDGVRRVEYAADGRHLLAVADKNAYVLRLKPFDHAAYVLSCCEKVLEQNPKSIDALLARGHVHLQKGELDEAIADFTEVIALDDKSAAAYHGRGLARTDKGDYAGARDDFAAALNRDPKLAAVPGRPAP
jgi:hypothetical protein